MQALRSRQTGHPDPSRITASADRCSPDSCSWDSFSARSLPSRCPGRPADSLPRWPWGNSWPQPAVRARCAANRCESDRKASQCALRPWTIKQFFSPCTGKATRPRLLFGTRSSPKSGIEPASRSRSAQAVPDPTATAVLVQRAALNQRTEVLLERVAAGPGQLDGLADGDAAMLAGEFDNL